MAYSYVVYTGNGATTQYSVPFPYIRKEHVYVSINYSNTTAFTWVNASTIQMNSAPANGARVEVRRTTPVSAPLVDFADGSTLVAADLDTVNMQQTYINQEQDDQFQDAVFINTQGLLDAGGKRITNVGNPTAAQDAATKSYADTWFNTYGEVYLGSYATDPATKPNGGALTVGVWYFNTTANRIKIYNGQIWTDGASPSGIVRWKKTAAGGETSLSGADDNSFTLAYTPALEQLYINGALQTRAVDYLATNGTSVTGLAALTAGDVVEVLSFNNWVAATVPDASVTNAKVAAGAGIAASKLSFTQAGTGALERTIEGRLRDVISVKDFGAVGDGVANDKNAIQAAITAAAAAGAAVYFPPGTYKKGSAGDGSGQQWNVPSGVKLYANGDATIKCFGYPIAILSAGSSVSGLTFDCSSPSAGVAVGLQVQGNDVTIKDTKIVGGSQVVYIYTADRLLVDGCRFEGCGYQILQKAGEASNDCKVVNCTSVGCTADFVELNSASVPCKNWLISGNTVKNLYLTSGTATTEARFVGSTYCSGLVITNNLVDTIGGDSAIHLEVGSENVTISDNIFVDCHGTYAKVLFTTAGASIKGLVFESNIVRFSSTYTQWTGDSTWVVFMVNNDDSRPILTTNQFINESGLTTLNVAAFGDTEDVFITNNRVRGFNIGIYTGFGASGGGVNRRYLYLTGNKFENVTTGCSIDLGGTGRSYSYFIENNVFENTATVFTHTGEPPVCLRNNLCRGTTSIDEAAIIGFSLQTNRCVGNALTGGATTTRAATQVYTASGSARKLYTLSTETGYGTVYLSVKTGNNNNATMKLVRLDRTSPIAISLTEIYSIDSGATSPFTLSLSGVDVMFTASATSVVTARLLNCDFPAHVPSTIATP